jgi:hypothetical protein
MFDSFAATTFVSFSGTRASFAGSRRSLRKIAGSSLRGREMGTSALRSGNSTTCAAILPPESGVGNWALAIAAARGSSAVARLSCTRRSTLVPHMPQNFNPGSFTWLHAEHFMLRPPELARRSVCRRSSRTPHMPQNLCSRRFSVPQKVQSMRYLTPLTCRGTPPPNSSSVLCRMTIPANKLQPISP